MSIEKEYQCLKCDNNTKFYIHESGSQTGLYCKECGAWVKWLGKSEISKYSSAQSNEKNLSLSSEEIEMLRMLTSNKLIEINMIQKRAALNSNIPSVIELEDEIKKIKCVLNKLSESL